MSPAGDTPGIGPPIAKTHGLYNQRTLPSWMDPEKRKGKLTVLMLESRDGDILPKNPFMTARSIHKAAGAIEEATTERRGTRYVLKVRNDEQVQDLLAMTELIDGTKVVVTEHTTLNIVQCKVSCWDAVDMTEDDLLKELEDQGVVKVRRLKRKNEKGAYVNTPAVVLTIKGTVIPEHVYFGMLRCKTQLFYPSPMQCYNCFEFGHTKTRCQKVKVCRDCGQAHAMVENAKCTNPVRCVNCKEAHSATSDKCQIVSEEKEIVRIRVEQGYSFLEARKIVRMAKERNTYANVVANEGEKMRRHNGNSTPVQNRLDNARNGCACACKCGARQEQIDKTTRPIMEQISSSNSRLCQSQSKRLPMLAPGPKTLPKPRDNTGKGKEYDTSDTNESTDGNGRRRRNRNRNTGAIPKTQDITRGKEGEDDQIIVDTERTPKRKSNNVTPSTERVSPNAKKLAIPEDDLLSTRDWSLDFVTTP